MDNKDMRVLYWKNTLLAAAVLGILYTIQLVAGYLLRNIQSPISGSILSLYGFAVIVWSLVYFGRRAEGINNFDGRGYSYGAAFGFSLLVLVLSAVIAGFGQWVLQNMIDPTYYDAVYQKTASLMAKNMGPEQQKALRGSADIMRSVWGMIGAMIFSMLMLGGLVALATAAMVRKAPSINKPNDNQQINN